MQQLEIGTTYADYFSPTGSRVLHVRIDRHAEHTSVTVVLPWETSLDRQFARHAEADTYLAFLRASVEAGQPVWQIEQAAGALTSAAAVYDQYEQDTIDGINAGLETDQAQRDQATAELLADAKAIVGDGQGWNALRQDVRRDFSKGRVHAQPPTPAELARIRAHNQGVVTRAPGQSWLVLRGIHDRKLGEPVYEPGSRKIAAVKLNARGLALAGQGQVAA